MSREFQRAIAGEIKAEIARQGLSRIKIGAEVGIDPTSWGNYFVNLSRDVPMPVVTRVCRILGVPFSVIVARAEAAEPLAVDALEEPTATEAAAIKRGRKRRGVAE